MRQFEMWPVHPCRLPDELLSSWLIRIAQAHGLKLHTFTHRAFPGYSIWNRDIDKTAADGLIKIISQRTGRTFSEVYQSTLKSLEGYLFETLISGNTKWLLPIGVYHRKRKRNGIAACPLCLVEDTTPYFRRLWRIGFTVVCTKHSVWMIDECPVCKSPISFHRNDFEHKYIATKKSMNICYSCGFDYTNTEPKIETDPIFLTFLNNLEKTLNKGYIALDDKIVYSHLYFYVLHQLVKLISINKHGIKLRQLLESESESGFTCDYTPHSKITFVDTLPLSQRRHALRLISRLMITWPQSFIVACEKAKLTRSRLEKDMKAVPFWYSQILHNYLDETSYGPTLDEIGAAHRYLQSIDNKVSRQSLKKLMGFNDLKRINEYCNQNISQKGDLHNVHKNFI
jgi:hypothetical protein